MIDIKRLRQDPDGEPGRAPPPARPVGRCRWSTGILELDRRRRELLVRAETLKAERNAATRGSGAAEEGRRLRPTTCSPSSRHRARGKQLEPDVREIDAELEGGAARGPEPPHADVPDGDASANRVVRTWGEPPTFDFAPKPHWELGAALGILDLPRGRKVAGSGFPLFTGDGCDDWCARSPTSCSTCTPASTATPRCAPPYLVNRATMQGTGQLPKFAEELYTVPADGLFLIPTAEVPVTNIHRDDILEAAALPVAYVAWTPCFRREAGAAGKDTRGLHSGPPVRQGRAGARGPARRAPRREHELHHRAGRGGAAARWSCRIACSTLAAGDTGFASARTYDLETWAAGRRAHGSRCRAQHLHRFPGPPCDMRFRPEPGPSPSSSTP